MKRWYAYVGAGVLVSLTAWGIHHALSQRAKRRREAEYEKVLRSYSEAFKTGMKRHEVEDHPSARHMAFRQMCCVSVKEFSRGVYDHAYDDLVKIGQEPVPWFCSENNVYIAFQFLGSKPQSISEADSSDTLKDLSVFHWLQGCL